MTFRTRPSIIVLLRYMSMTGSMFTIYRGGLPIKCQFRDVVSSYLIKESIAGDLVVLRYDRLLVLPDKPAIVVIDRNCCAYPYLHMCSR